MASPKKSLKPKSVDSQVSSDNVLQSRPPRMPGVQVPGIQSEADAKDAFKATKVNLSAVVSSDKVIRDGKDMSATGDHGLTKVVTHKVLSPNIATSHVAPTNVALSAGSSSSSSRSRDKDEDDDAYDWLVSGALGMFGTVKDFTDDVHESYHEGEKELLGFNLPCAVCAVEKEQKRKKRRERFEEAKEDVSDFFGDLKDGYDDMEDKYGDLFDFAMDEYKEYADDQKQQFEESAGGAVGELFGDIFASQDSEYGGLAGYGKEQYERWKEQQEQQQNEQGRSAGQSDVSQQTSGQTRRRLLPAMGEELMEQLQNIKNSGFDFGDDD